MQKQPMYLSKILDEEELKHFKEGLRTDKVHLPSLLKIFKHRRREVGRRDDLLDDPNYPIKRAYLDGRDKELGWFLKLFEGEGGSDQ